MPAPTRAWTARRLSIWPETALMSPCRARGVAGAQVRGDVAQDAEEVAARARRAAEDLVAVHVDGEGTPGPISRSWLAASPE